MSVEPKPDIKAEVLKLIRDNVDRTLALMALGIGERVETARASAPELDVRDVIEGDDLIGAIDLYFELLDTVIPGADDCYEHLTPAPAAEIGLTPNELERLNGAIDHVNSAVAGLSPTGLPLGAPRQEVMLFLATAVAYAPAIRLGLGALGIIWKLLKLLWKLLKWLISGRKHIRKIKQAQRLRDAGRISAGTARRVIAARLAALAALIASITAEINEARRLIEELRRQGRSEEADDLERRVRDMEERLRELQREHDELRQQEQPSPR